MGKVGRLGYRKGKASQGYCSETRTSIVVVVDDLSHKIRFQQSSQCIWSGHDESFMVG
jgi:hypothetical protein